jgi:hypothetical protein
MKLYTIYSPPAHADRTVHKIKADAEKEEVSYHKVNFEPLVSIENL